MVKNKKDAELIRQLADSMTSYGVVFGKNNFCMVYLVKYCKRLRTVVLSLVVEVAGIQPAC